MRRRDRWRRTDPRPRGGRHGQDPDARPSRRVSRRAGRPRRPHSSPDVHEPRRARDARARREGGRSRGVDHLVRHVPLDLRTVSAPLRILPRLPARLPDHRRGGSEEDPRGHHQGERRRSEGLSEEGADREDDQRGGERAEARRLHRAALADEGRGLHARADRRDRREVRRAQARAQFDGLRRPARERTQAPQDAGPRPRAPAGALPLRARRRVPGYERTPGRVHGHPRGEAPQHPRGGR